jgi:hypothetical protein
MPIRKFIRVALPTTILLTMTPACDALTTTAEWTDEDAREAISGLLDTTLPDEIANPHLVERGWGIQWHARFEADPAEVQAWLDAGVLCWDPAMTADPTDAPFPTNINGPVPAEDWWQPGAAEVYAIDVCDTTDPHQYLIIDQSDDSRWIIYVYFSDI